MIIYKLELLLMQQYTLYDLPYRTYNNIKLSSVSSHVVQNIQVTLTDLLLHISSGNKLQLSIDKKINILDINTEEELSNK
jgi:hypothetical protein